MTRHLQWPAVIFLTALIIRFMYLVAGWDHPLSGYPILDAATYDRWAQTIAAGDWPGGVRAYLISPFYAYFLAFIYGVGGHSYGLVRIIQVVIGSMTCAVIFLIARQLFTVRAAVIAGLVMALYGYAVFLDAELLKNSVAAFTLSVSLLCCLHAWNEKKTGWWFAAGFLLGLTSINTPNVLLLSPVMGIWALGCRPEGSRYPRAAVVFASGFILCLLPVTVRNYVLEQEVVLVSSYGGHTFYFGNNPESDGALLSSREFFEIVPERLEALVNKAPAEALGRKLSSSEVSRWWFRKGVRFIQEQPAAFARLLGKKLAIFFSGYEISDTVDYYFMKEQIPVLRLGVVNFGLIVALAFSGLIASLPQWRKQLPVYSLLVVLMLSVVLFMVNSRYRFAAVPLLAVYAGYGADRIWAGLQERSWRRTAFTLIMVAAVFFLTTISILHYPPEYSRKFLADAQLSRGKCPEALKEYQVTMRSLSQNPSVAVSYAAALDRCGFKDDALTHYLNATFVVSDPVRRAQVHDSMGKLSFERNDFPAALLSWQKAVADNPENPEFLNNLAFVLYKQGKRLPDAKAYAERALALRPASPEIMDTLGIILLKLGDYAAALNLLEKAKTLMPDSPDISRHHAEAAGLLRERPRNKMD